MQGRLIVFEGVEGCGKTTQIRRSQSWLLTSGILQQLQEQGHLAQLIITREPGGTEVGQAIRQLLLHPSTCEPICQQAELLLYASDRAQHVETLLKPELAKGSLILCDRYTDSTIAYQGHGRGLSLDLIQQLNQMTTNGLESDLTIWLDIDAAAGLARTQQRGVADRMEQSHLEFHRRVQQGFVELANAHPHRIVRVDASSSEADVTRQIQDILQQRLSEWYQPFLIPS
jgi:dTMP kinase